MTPKKPANPPPRKCPICGRPADPQGQFFPFCGDRCKTIDLGRWAKGDYKVSRPLEEKDLEDGE